MYFGPTGSVPAYSYAVPSGRTENIFSLMFMTNYANVRGSITGRGMGMSVPPSYPYGSSNIPLQPGVHNRSNSIAFIYENPIAKDVPLSDGTIQIIRSSPNYPGQEASALLPIVPRMPGISGASASGGGGLSMLLFFNKELLKLSVRPNLVGGRRSNTRRNKKRAAKGVTKK